MKVDLSNYYQWINPVYRPHLKKNTPIEIYFGSAGSGKSVFVVQKILYRVLSNPLMTFLCLRKTKVSLSESVFKLFCDMIYSLGLSKCFKITSNPMKIKCVNGATIIFSGLDDVEKIKSVICHSIWVEEATEITEGDFDQILLRPRGGKFFKQVILSFNPVSASHWIKRRFFNSPQNPEDASILKSTYLDNKWIGKDYHRRMEMIRATNPEYYQIYALGEWGILQGAIFSPPKILTIDGIYDERRACFGIDFGYNDPSTLVGCMKNGGSLLMHEYIYESNLTTDDFISKIKSLNLPFNTVFYADCSRPDAIESMNRAGLLVKPSRKGPNSIIDGINLLKNYQLWITPESRHLMNEFINYKWDIDKDGKPLDKPKDEFNHAIDALRYAIYTNYFQPQVKTSLMNRQLLGF